MRKSQNFCLPFLVLASFLAVQSASACDLQLMAGDDVQAAIDAALGGEVICLDPGLYSPTSTIVVDKTLTLSGPLAAIDPRPSASAGREIGNPSTEAIIDGGGLSTVFAIAADGVILEGLEIRNGSGDLIASTTAVPTAGVIIRHNIIHGSSGDEGIQLRKTASAAILYNHVFDTAGDGINVCCGSSQAAVRFNEVHDIASVNAAIYLYDDAVPATDIDAIISDNLVYDVLVNDGIKLGDAGGADVHVSGGGILNNVIHDTAEDCITVFTSDVLVDGNQCSGSLSENGAIFVDYPVDTVVITSNDVHDNGAPDDGRTTYGIRIGKDSFPLNVTVNLNSIRRNEAGLIYVFPEGAPALDATNNYWGSSTGPSGAGSGLGDSVSENVLFEPFLTACSLGSCPAGGGQAFILTIMEIQSVIDDPATPSEVAQKLRDKVREKVKKAFEEFLKGHPKEMADALKGAIEELEKIFDDFAFDTVALQAEVAELAVGQLADLNERVGSITGAGDQDLQFAQTALGDAMAALSAGNYRQAALLTKLGAEEVQSPDYLGDFCSGPASGSYQGFVCEIQASRNEARALVVDDEDSDSDTKRAKEAAKKIAEGLEKLAVVAVKEGVHKLREAAEKLADISSFVTVPEQELLADNASALLQEYLADATASGHDPSDLQEAAQFYSQGESLRLGGDPVGALEKYEKAADKASP